MSNLSHLKNIKANLAISKPPLILAFSILLVALAALIAVLVSTNADAADQNTYAEHVPGEVIVKVETDVYLNNANSLTTADKQASTNSREQANNQASTNSREQADNQVSTNYLEQADSQTSTNFREQANNQINDFLSKYDCDTLLCVTGSDEIYNDLNSDQSMITIKDVADTNYKPAQTRYIKIKFNEEEKSMSKMLSELKANSIVKEAEPNYIFQSCGTETNSDEYSNDVDFSSAQWAYDTEGSTSAHNKAGMNVANWNTATPNVPADDKVVVAVVDSGVDYNHPDLQCAGSDKAYGNLKTIIGYGGAQGYNAGVDDPQSTEAEDPMDNMANHHGHGTHVSGIIAATWNNNGVAGGASVCSILPVKAADPVTGDNDVDAILRAYAYIIKAKQAGINVKAANNSWAGASPANQIIDLVNLLGQNGIISAFGTGNDKINTDNYSFSVSGLQNNPYVIAVDSTNKAGYMSSFSNYGVKTTDVCAPGDDIYSTVPSWTDYEGQTANLMSSDTRYMHDGDYTTVDSFEESTTQKFQYYADLQSPTPLDIVGSSDNPLGYKSDRALKVDTGAEGRFVVITGNYSDIKDAKRLSLLFNYECLTPNTDEGYCNLYDGNNGGQLISTSQMSPANNELRAYGSVSAQVSKIKSDSSGKFVLIAYFVYENENKIQVANTAYIDNVSLSYKEYPYKNMTGTSMATPACCGMAAVVAAKYKDEPAEKIVARIKGGTNHKPWLADKCYSGGIVDLGRASSSEAALDPVVLSASLEAATDTSSTIKLTGYFLGDSSSVVTINGKTATTVVGGSEGARETLTCTFSEKVDGAIAVTVNKAGKQLTRYFSVASSDNILLERINMPDKSKAENSWFYTSEINYLKYASNNYLMVCCSEDSSPRYIYDINNQSWEAFFDSTEILNAIRSAGIDSTTSVYVCGKDDTLIYAGTKNDETGDAVNAIAYYNLNSKQISVEEFETPNIYLSFGFVDGDKLYIAAKTLSEGAQVPSMFEFNMDTKDFQKIDTDATSVETLWETIPKVYKVSEDEFLLIDQGKDPTPKTVINDMYTLKFSSINNEVENGEGNGDVDATSAAITKLEQSAYPTTVTDTTQDKYVGHAFVDGKLMMIGPTLFDSVSGGVSADTYLHDIDTQAESVMSGLLSYNRAYVASCAKGGDYVYTYFVDAIDGPAIAKRYVGTPGPGPTPGPATDVVPTSTAATGDPIGQLIWEFVWQTVG